MKAKDASHRRSSAAAVSQAMPRDGRVVRKTARALGALSPPCGVTPGHTQQHTTGDEIGACVCERLQIVQRTRR